MFLTKQQSFIILTRQSDKAKMYLLFYMVYIAWLYFPGSGLLKKINLKKKGVCLLYPVTSSINGQRNLLSYTFSFQDNVETPLKCISEYY